jgi:sugar phosphate isomerase/epimerase
MQKNVNDISPAVRRNVRELAAAHELEIIGLHWLLAFTEGFYLTSPDPSVQHKTTDYLKQLSQLCADLGGKLMVLGSPQQRNLLPGVTHAQAMQIAADVIGGAAATFAGHGVCLALEPLGPQEGDFLLTAEKGIELARLIDHPNVRLHLDVKAMSSESKPIPDIIRDSRDYLAHFHANDANRRGPGMGEIDFVPIIQTLREIGYDGWVSVEVFDYEPGVETLAGESIRYLRKIIDQLG